MTKITGYALLLVSMAGLASAAIPVGAPEIDPANAMAALTLLSGALLVIRGRRK